MFCFENCKKLKKFTLPEGTTKAVRMFRGCSKVKVKVFCPRKKLNKYFFMYQEFPTTATILVPKEKPEEYKAQIAKFETDTYKIQVREMEE